MSGGGGTTEGVVRTHGDHRCAEQRAVGGCASVPGGGGGTHGSPKIGSIENDDSAMPIEKYCINNRGWAALFSFGRW